MPHTTRSPGTGHLFVPIQLVAGQAKATRRVALTRVVVAGENGRKSYQATKNKKSGPEFWPLRKLVAGARLRLYRKLCWVAA